jgi:predicted nucleic acid-binding protein
MTLYVDSSALVKRYVDETDSEAAEAVLLSDPDWVTARITLAEIRLALQRRLDDDVRTIAVAAFERDWERTFVVEVDAETCRRAVEFGTVTGSRTLDALHLAAAERAGGRSLPIVTFDVRLGHAARSLGFSVVWA